MKRLAKTEQVLPKKKELLPAVLSKEPPPLSTEQVFEKEYLYMFKRLGRLIRKAEEHAYEKGNSREYYALCTLISQQREVIADLRSISDLQGQVDILIEQSLQPMMTSIGQLVISSFYQQRALLTEVSKEGELKFATQKLNEITGDITKGLQAEYEKAALRIADILVGPPTPPKSKKKKS